MPGEQETVLWALLVTATVTDLLWGKIFNAVVFPAMAGGYLYRAWAAGAASGNGATAGILAAFIFFYPLYLLRVISAGDAKLLMAVGAWSNIRFVFLLGSCSVVIAAGAGLWILLKKEGLKGSLESIGQHLNLKRSPYSHRMPFAPAFLCAFLLIKTVALCQWNVF